MHLLFQSLLDFSGGSELLQTGHPGKGQQLSEALNSLDTVVFDKTVHLPKVFSKLQACICRETTKEQLLEYAAKAESFSNHPIARSIMKAYGGDIEKDALT